jgi:PAS domain S-box-containing protein
MLMQRLQRWAIYLSIAVIIIGILVLTGWQFQVNFLKRPVEGLTAMNPLTALLFIFCGTSVLLLRSSENDHNYKRSGQMIAMVILCVALLRFVLPVDTLLYPHALTGDMKLGISNRMPLNTAFTFVFCALGLIFIHSETKAKMLPGQGIAVIVFLIALISVLGYLYNIKLFYGSFLHIPIAVHSATGFVFLSISVLFVHPDKGLVKEISSRFSGSFIARFLIPVSIVVPMLLGLIYLEGVWQKSFSIEMGTAFFVLSIILIFLSLTWFIVVTLNKRDLQKKESDNALLKFNETLEQKIQERTETIERSEKQYRYLFKNNPMPMWVIDLESFRFLDVNEMATYQYGYTREEFLNMTAIDIRPDSDREFFIKSDHSFTNAATNYNRGIWNHIKKDGSIIHVEIIAHEIIYEGKKARLILSNDVTEQRKAEERIVREISDRKKAQEQIEQLNAELEHKVLLRTEQLKRSNEELEAFSYSVSHDLRAPLRAIIGFSSILQEDHVSKLDDEARRITEVIISNTKKMGQLIDDLLTFSRMGRQDILETEVDSNAVVKEIIDGLSEKDPGANNINWDVHNLPCVKGDLNIIRQVWVNLISNAVKYSEKVSNPRIEIGASPDEKEVVFFIKDNGVGFDEKYKEKLFRVFQRLHTNDEFEGTGIGLAIVEKIVSKHGGRVWANGTVNEGACFYFSLPANTDKDKITKTQTL